MVGRTRPESPHGPAAAILPQPRLPGQRAAWGGGTSGSTAKRSSGIVCQRAGGPFAATTGTPFYRLHTAADLVTLVLTLLSHGCPPQAIVAAFGLDERTVARWLARAGTHCQRVHEHLVEQGQVDLQHVQADELWVKQVGQRVWMALALAVPTRLWLGGAISPQRDLALITGLVQQVRACAAPLALLVCVDGLASYVTAFLKVFRNPIYTGRRGRPRLVLADGLPAGPGRQAYAQAARRRRQAARRAGHRGRRSRRCWRRPAPGTASTPPTSSGSTPPSAPARAAGAAGPRHRPQGRTLTAGMWLVGTAYNFCWPHDSLRQLAPVGAGRKWQERTPAMAAGLTDHPWTLHELLRYQVPLPAGYPPSAGADRPKPRRCRSWRWPHEPRSSGVVPITTGDHQKIVLVDRRGLDGDRHFAGRGRTDVGDVDGSGRPQGLPNASILIAFMAARSMDWGGCVPATLTPVVATPCVAEPSVQRAWGSRFLRRWPHRRRRAPRR